MLKEGRERNMINKYAKGANFERKLVNAARNEGHIAFRTAGSHSPVDVVIIDPLNLRIVCIQAKKGTAKLSRVKKNQFNILSGKYKVEFKVLEEADKRKKKKDGKRNNKKSNKRTM